MNTSKYLGTVNKKQKQRTGITSCGSVCMRILYTHGNLTVA